MGTKPQQRSFLTRLRDFERARSTDAFNADQFRKMNRVSAAQVKNTENPVLFFNASTRLTRTSLNAAFAWLTAVSLQSSGVPTAFLVCQQGLHPCLLATDREDVNAPLPCRDCVRLSQSLYAGLTTIPLLYREDPQVFNEVEGLELAQLATYEHQGVPLGKLTLPSLRWILRRHHLENVPNAARLHRMYIRSAWSVYLQSSEWIQANQPRAIVVFNGLQYPEAIVKWVGRQRIIPTFTHEIGLMPETAFFTKGEATACPITVPETLEMTAERNAQLDAYLSDRVKGTFTTAGVQFWQQMQGLTPDFWNLARTFRQIVPIFTNVIFDTSQKHANVVFDDMFAWLDCVKGLIEKNAGTFFVIRAHPDEIRPGKESLETVTDWVNANHLTHLPNVLFIGPDQFFSSYDLISLAKLVLVYNSTIGLEAAAMGAAVVSGGKSRFTQMPITWFPPTRADFEQQVQGMLDAPELSIPPEFQTNARKFLYYQFFHTALRFDDFIQPDSVWKGYVRLTDFKPEQLLPENSETMRVIQDGILRGQPFVLPL